MVAGVIKELGIIEMIDARIPDDEQEHVTTGEAIAAMILNGLGFTSQPLYMTPRFFEAKPLEELFRKVVLGLKVHESLWLPFSIPLAFYSCFPLEKPILLSVSCRGSL